MSQFIFYLSIRRNHFGLVANVLVYNIVVNKFKLQLHNYIHFQTITLGFGLVWFGFFVKRHINFHGLLSAKVIFVEEQQWYYLTHNWGNKGVHTFPKDVSPKVKVTSRPKFKLVYFKVAIQLGSHYSTETPSVNIVKGMNPLILYYHWLI